MLSKEALIVLRHYLQQGLSKTAIAEKLGINRRTVQRYLQSGKTEARYQPRPARPSKLDALKPYLRGRLQDYPELSAVRLLAEIRERGYTGNYTILKDFLRTQRPKAPLRFEQRYEVAPGQQAQVDFATFRTPFGTVQAFLVVLSWSRTLWVGFGLHQDQLTVLAGLHQAFLAFGGVPHSLLFDRMRTAVAGAPPPTAAPSSMRRCCASPPMRVSAQWPAAPTVPKPRGASSVPCPTCAIASSMAASSMTWMTSTGSARPWLTTTANARLHATTGEIPAERLLRERAHLLPLPPSPYVPLVTLGRRVSRDGFVSYQGNAYSVPDGLDRAEVQAYASLTDLRLFQDGRLVASHPLKEGRGERILAPEHHRSRPATPEPAGGARRAAAALAESVEVERRSLEVYEQVLR